VPVSLVSRDRRQERRPWGRAPSKQPVRLFSLITCAVLFALSSHSVSAERLPLKAYTTADGLPHNLINRIVRDSRGFIWFCTAEGLSRFDGYTFTNYTTDHGLPHGNVTDFLEAKNGELWVGTGGGLVRFDPKGTPSDRVRIANESEERRPPMFGVVLPEDGDRRARAVTVLLEGRDGTIWCGTRKHLYRLDQRGGRFALVPTEIGLASEHPTERAVLDLLEDRNGTLWVASLGWLRRRWPDGSFARYTKRDGLPDDNIHDLFEDRQGRLWAATRLGGLLLLKADGSHSAPVVVRTYAAEDGLMTNWVSQIIETVDGRFWIATNNGLVEFFPDAGGGPRFHVYTQKNGLLYYGLNTLTADPDGNLWLGSDVGAMKLARDGFVSYGEQDGLLSVNAVFGDREAGVCFRASIFGTERPSAFEGATSYLPRRVEHYHTRYGRFGRQGFIWFRPEALANAYIGWVGEKVTLQARDGEWWLGTGTGLYRFPPSDFARLARARPLSVYTTKDGLSSLQVFRLFEDSRGDIWVSTIAPNGLARWERATNRWHNLSNAANLPSPADALARTFGEDRLGNVWIGFDTGVARYRDGRITMYSAADGLPAGAVQDIYSDSSGRLWFASSRSGLIRVDMTDARSPSFVGYGTAQGLSGNDADAITEDLHGKIYVGTGRGLDRLDPRTGNVKHFTTSDGLAPGKIAAVFRDHSGALWLGTAKGLSRYVPAPDEPLKPPRILISALRLGTLPQNISALGETDFRIADLPATYNPLQIDFVGLSYTPGDVLRYQYRLGRADTDWSAATEQRTVTYANLAPGRYRFIVRAVNSDGMTSAVPAAVTFAVLRPVWQRSWFVALAASALSLALFAAYRYRVRRLLEVASMRTRIATDLHDDIGANLTRIAVLSEVARQQSEGEDAEREGQLSSIARISRESVAAMGDIVWAINPQRDTLLDLVRRMREHAEEVCLPRNIDLTFRSSGTESPLKLGIDIRRDVYLIFKEAVNNALRHSDCGLLAVTIAQENGFFALTVRDNGRGFDLSGDGCGNGLANMQRRAEAHGGRLTIESRTGAGTTIALWLPYTAPGYLQKHVGDLGRRRA
jgi:ligand-binding sensor domain-containing protein/signal transduction histidine kinase